MDVRKIDTTAKHPNAVRITLQVFYSMRIPLANNCPSIANDHAKCGPFMILLCDYELPVSAATPIVEN